MPHGNPVQLIRANVLPPFVRYLEGINAPVDRRLCDSSLPAKALMDPECVVPIDQVLRFLSLNADAEGGDGLGFRVGSRTRVAELGDYGLLIRNLATLGKALENASEYASAFSSAQKIWVEGWGGKVRVCHGFRLSLGAGFEVLNQFMLMILIDCIRLAAGPGWKPVEIHLDARSPLRHREGYSGGAPIALLDVSAIVLDGGLLTMPINGARRIERKPEKLLATAPAHDLPGAVKQIIESLMSEGNVPIGRVAAICGMSARTLQRRLSMLGKQYSDLVLEARRQSAIDLLNDPQPKLLAIAHELGYSDAASFTRAFRRWTGTTPSGFRGLNVETLQNRVASADALSY
jgi:AraC-like DNA-binding protein